MKRVVSLVALVAGLVASGHLASLSDNVKAEPPHAVTTATCQAEGGGWIGALWCAYGDYPDTNPLGRALEGERDFYTNNLLIDNVDRDKYQRFQNGTIYYNSYEKAAFAIFGALDGAYFSKRAALGLPISSEVNPPVTQKACLGLFQRGFLECSSPGVIGDTRLWSSYSGQQMKQYIPLPSLKMPFDQSETHSYSSGPHSWSYTGGLGKFDAGNGSGIDIAGTFDVRAMASGTIVGIDRDDCTYGEDKELACWVAVRHDFSGSVLVYGHIEPLAQLQVGQGFGRAIQLETRLLV